MTSCIAFVPALALGATQGSPREVAIATAMPRLGDHTLLSWRAGAPYYTTARYSSERRFLRLETGYYAAEFDTKKIAVAGFARMSVPRDEAAATRAALAAEPLPAAQLHLRIRADGTDYVCSGQSPVALDGNGMPAKPLEFPVKVIESGRFFQQFTLHDLEFHDAAGQRLPATARLEISTIENRSAVPQRLALNFEHTPVKAITGYVPMIVDPQERPVGIPVQISKNWHQVRTGVDLPHAGPCMHGRTWLNLAPESRVTLGYGTTFARWGGAPSASLAQLSLVGWGHNGFWDQFALGSFGEAFCFQAGRVMRRTLFTDFRPIFQRGFTGDERWAWTGNVGGSDTMVRLDAQGRYVPFQRNVTRYASHGPNLAHLVYDEVSADDAVRSRVEVLLPRTDDCTRVYLRIHYSVTRLVRFSRLALFQLGADYYNDADSSLIAWGNARGFVAERGPKPAAGVRALPAWMAHGDHPWISLHGEVRADSERTGQATRGLILREWRAVLGGKPAPVPYFAAIGSRGSKSRLAAEIVPPPDVDTLAAGDSVDMLIELLALPRTAERYYGPDPAFAAALAAGANTWRMVHRESAANRPTLQMPDGSEVTGWPLTIPAAAEGTTAFTLSGGLGWIPVRLTGLPGADAVELWHETPAGLERVVQGDPARAYWQSDYNAGAARWSITYNLPAPGRPAAYVAKWRAASPSATDKWPGEVILTAP